MPNHVSQDLVISGDIDTLKEFMEFSEDEEQYLSANKFIPYPKEYKEKDDKVKALREAGDENWYKVKDGFGSGGYQWCIQNWGTKWGIYNCKRSISTTFGTKKNGKVSYEFNSAWNPAIKIIHAMSLRFPTLEFKLKYYERGMGFQGTYIVFNGEELKNETRSYSGHRGG